MSNLAQSWFLLLGVGRRRDKSGPAYEKVAQLILANRSIRELEDAKNDKALGQLADAYSLTQGRQKDAKVALDSTGAGRGCAARADNELMQVVAGAYWQIGDRPMRIDWLGPAVKAGYSCDKVKRSPFFEELRKDPGICKRGLQVTVKRRTEMAKKSKAKKARSTRKAKKIYVVAHEFGYRVYPPTIVLTKGDTFKFVNMTGLDLEWTVRNAPFGRGTSSGAVGKGQQSHLVRVPSHVELRKYDYEVLVAGTTKAQGNSDPMIIIDPPRARGRRVSIDRRPRWPPAIQPHQPWPEPVHVVPPGRVSSCCRQPSMLAPDDTLKVVNQRLSLVVTDGARSAEGVRSTLAHGPQDRRQVRLLKSRSSDSMEQGQGPLRPDDHLRPRASFPSSSGSSPAAGSAGRTRRRPRPPPARSRRRRTSGTRSCSSRCWRSRA